MGIDAVFLETIYQDLGGGHMIEDKTPQKCFKINQLENKPLRMDLMLLRATLEAYRH